MLNKHEAQDYGNDPLAVRESDKYQEEYVHAFVDKWDELIDWDGRAKAEGGFFIDKLHEHGARKVLVVATGTGFHSVQLIEAGFEVTSVDGSTTMLAKVFDNARKRGRILRTIQADWRWLNRDVHGLPARHRYRTATTCKRVGPVMEFRLLAKAALQRQTMPARRSTGTAVHSLEDRARNRRQADNCTSLSIPDSCDEFKARTWPKLKYAI